MTITSFNLFGRQDITDRERRILHCANEAAKTLFQDRYKPDLKDNWDINVDNLKLEDVERDVIKAMLSKYDFVEIKYMKKKKGNGKDKGKKC